MLSMAEQGKSLLDNSPPFLATHWPSGGLGLLEGSVSGDPTTSTFPPTREPEEILSNIFGWNPLAMDHPFRILTGGEASVMESVLAQLLGLEREQAMEELS